MYPSHDDSASRTLLLALHCGSVALKGPRLWYPDNPDSWMVLLCRLGMTDLAAPGW
jgi:hypothetical protein